jgi:hypothetical protein
MIDALPINPTQLTGLLVFGIAAIACARAGHVCKERRWWRLAGVSSVCMLEVALGLRHRAHDLVDAALQAGGWYDSRSQAQVLLLAAVALLAAVTLVWLLSLRGTATEIRVGAAASIAALWLFGIEAISLHAVDALMYTLIGPVLAIGWAWAALALVITAAALVAAKVSRENVPAPRR